MSEEIYYLIHNSDGDTTVRPIDKEKFLKELADGDYGDDVYFLDEIPSNNDTNYWGENSYLIIKGNIVTPKEKKVITEFKLD